MSEKIKCSVEGCPRQAELNRRGMCKRCRTAANAAGDRVYAVSRNRNAVQCCLSAAEDILNENCNAADWPGHRNAGGYGVVSYEGKRWLAHRLVYALAARRVDPNFCLEGRMAVVRHKCNNPNCTTLSHLVIGTQKDNMADMKRAGRSPDRKGENHPRAIFTDVSILAILWLYHADAFANIREIARQGYYNRHSVNGIIHGKSWASVSLPFYIANPYLRPSPAWQRRLGHLLPAGA